MSLSAKVVYNFGQFTLETLGIKDNTMSYLQTNFTLGREILIVGLLNF